jgi:hypothetical protein
MMKKKVEEEELDETGSESCPFADFDINSINNLDSTINDLVSFFHSPTMCVCVCVCDT